MLKEECRLMVFENRVLSDLVSLEGFCPMELVNADITTDF
jgi:hypothetical protein